MLKLNKKQKAILIGTVLGDAFLQATGKKNARLKLEHREKQKDYILWKVSQFPRLFLGKPNRLERKHPKTNKIYIYWRHQSNSSPEFGKFRNKFYLNGKKQIPENLSEILTDEISLAVWYMDDGYYYERDKNSFLYLGKVSEKEAVIVQDTIKKNFGIDSKIKNKKQKGFVVYFSPSETIELHKKIKKFVLPLFDYKISPSVRN